MVQPESVLVIVECIQVSVGFLIGCENLRALHFVEKLLDLSIGKDLADPPQASSDSASPLCTNPSTQARTVSPLSPQNKL